MSARYGPHHNAQSKILAPTAISSILVGAVAIH